MSGPRAAMIASSLALSSGVTLVSGETRILYVLRTT